MTVRQRQPRTLCIMGTCQLLWCLLAPPAEALACPDCRLGRDARATLLRDDVGVNLLAATLPFLLILVLCLVLEAAARRT